MITVCLPAGDEVVDVSVKEVSTGPIRRDGGIRQPDRLRSQLDGRMVCNQGLDVKDRGDTTAETWTREVNIGVVPTI